MTTASYSQIPDREHPRISANQLADFMTAGAHSQLCIIERAREPANFIVTRYRIARETISQALLDPRRANGLIESARDNLEQRVDDPSLSPFQRSDASLSLDALTAFDRLRNQLAGYTFKAPPPRWPYLHIAGVDISVNIDLVIETERQGKLLRGGVIFRLSRPEEDERDAARNRRLERATIAATLVRMQLGSCASQEQQVHHPICMSVDVQGGEIVSAPRSYRRRERDIEASCRIIQSMW